MLRKSVFIFLMLFTLNLLLWLGCGKDGESLRNGNRIAVRTAKVERRELTVPIHTSGKLVPAAEIKLSFKIGGIVAQILVDESHSVQKGQLLARLQQEEVRAKVGQARSAFRKAQRDYGRAVNLYEDSVATLEQKQNARTALDVARSDLEIAEFNLKHSEIRAPSDGIILKRFAEPNELVESGMPILYFGAGKKAWRVRTSVSDRQVLRIRLEDTARVRFDVYPSHTFPAVVTEIAESADPMTGTFETELRLNPPALNLVAGFIADVTIFPSQREQYFILPIEALVEADGQQGIVYTVENDTARQLQVEIGRILENRIAVSSGLQGISRVVTDGTPYLWEGARVVIKNGAGNSAPVNENNW